MRHLNCIQTQTVSPLMIEVLYAFCGVTAGALGSSDTSQKLHQNFMSFDTTQCHSSFSDFKCLFLLISETAEDEVVYADVRVMKNRRKR